VIIIIILGPLGSVEMTLIGMTIDIIRPMRGWTNPQQAMKQNLNVLIGMAISSLYLGALGFMSYKLILEINHNVLLTGIALVFMVTITVNYIILKNLIEKRLRDIEE
jgi:ABC-2 type transport system permease protein